MKPKINVYMEAELLDRLESYAAKAGVSISALGAEAIKTFLSPEEREKGGRAFLRRLDRLSRQGDRFGRDLAIVSETLALFIQYQLAVTPPIPVTDQKAARALGRERFEQFTHRVARRLASGKSLVLDVIDEISPDTADFYALNINSNDDKSKDETSGEHG